MKRINTPYNNLPFFSARDFQLHRAAGADAYIGAPNIILPIGNIPTWSVELADLIPSPVPATYPAWTIWDAETDTLFATPAPTQVDIRTTDVASDTHNFTHSANTTVSGMCGKYYIRLEVNGKYYYSGIWQNTDVTDTVGMDMEWYYAKVMNTKDAGDVFFSKGIEIGTYFRAYRGTPEVRESPESFLNGLETTFTSFDAIKERPVLRIPNATPAMRAWFATMKGNKMDSVELTHVASGETITVTEIETSAEDQTGSAPLQVLTLSYEGSKSVYCGHYQNIPHTVVREIGNE